MRASGDLDPSDRAARGTDDPGSPHRVVTGPSLAIGFQIYNQARIQEINDWRERLEFVAIRMRICIRQANDGEAGPWGPGMNFRVYGRESQRRFLNGQ